MSRNPFWLLLLGIAILSPQAHAQRCCTIQNQFRSNCASCCLNQTTVQSNFAAAPVSGVAAPAPFIGNESISVGCGNCADTPISTSFVNPVVSSSNDPVFGVPVLDTLQSPVPGYASAAPAVHSVVNSHYVQQPVVIGSAMPTTVMPYRATAFTQTSMQLTQPSTGLAQRKAQRAAFMGIKGHVGGTLGNARYEGVGWSTHSPQHAIQNCCYWGQRPPAQIGVARGNDGSWYACVLYR